MFGIGAYEITLLTTMGIAITVALSLNLITGFCGQISLGHAAFYGIGAYCAALMTKAGYPFAFAVVSGAVLSTVFGLIVGLASLRVRDDFLAITTMGAGFLFLGVVGQWDFVGGEMGVAGIPDTGLGKPAFMGLTLLIAGLTIIYSLYLKRSWLGFVFDAVAADEDTARVLGLNVSRYKLVAFAMGTAIAGVAGALYAHHIRFIDPDSFGFIESVSILSMVVIGGIGSVWGVVFAAIVLSLLPQWFQFIDDYKLLVYGGLLFFVMRFSPGGVAEISQKLWSRLRQLKSSPVAGAPE
ncbi:MAG: branched-chain amino acid ABC transporter permease [Sneathiella sp.]